MSIIDQTLSLCGERFTNHETHFELLPGEDPGPGIPPDVVRKMMNPFFTTKEIGKGTGLGLSISQGILGNHGGRLVRAPVRLAVPGPSKQTSAFFLTENFLQNTRSCKFDHIPTLDEIA